MEKKDYIKFIKTRNKILIDHLLMQPDEVYVKFDKYSILLNPGVFNPILGEGSLLLRDCKKQLFGKKVLDLGTGTGILSILASEGSDRVIATDISHNAVDCAIKNVKKYHLEEKIEVREGDLFLPVKGEKFDKIIFNPPFIEGQPKSIIEHSYFDKHYETLTKFFNNVRNYLQDSGEIVLSFGSVGDINYLNWLITINDFEFQFVINRLINNLQFFVYKIH